MYSIFFPHHPCASLFWKVVSPPFQKTSLYWNFLFLSKYHSLLLRNISKIFFNLQTCHPLCLLFAIEEGNYFFLIKFFSNRNLRIFTFYLLVLFEWEFREKIEHVELNNPAIKNTRQRKQRATECGISRTTAAEYRFSMLQTTIRSKHTCQDLLTRLQGFLAKPLQITNCKKTSKNTRS